MPLHSGAIEGAPAPPPSSTPVEPADPEATELDDLDRNGEKRESPKPSAPLVRPAAERAALFKEWGSFKVTRPKAKQNKKKERKKERREMKCISNFMFLSNSSPAAAAVARQAWYKPQPMRMIRSYFGDKYGWYLFFLFHHCPQHG